MSLPASEYWFSTVVRRNRKSFMFANAFLLAILALVIGILAFFDVRLRSGQIIFLLFYIPFFIAQYFLTAQRIRDFGVTGWMALLWVPIALLPPPYSGAFSMTFLIVLCAIPGTEGDNRYGSDPLKE